MAQAPRRKPRKKDTKPHIGPESQTAPDDPEAEEMALRDAGDTALTEAEDDPEAAGDFDEEDDGEGKNNLPRDAELATEAGGNPKWKDLRDKLLKLYADVEQGYIKQSSRADQQMEYWDAYNCEIGGNQAYNGNSQIYVPIIYNAVNARATRFTNQLFPKGGRYVEAVSTDNTEPFAITALLEHYVRKSKLRTEVAPALCVSGDLEGQYNVYVGWSTHARHVVWKERQPLTALDVPLPEEEIEEIKRDVILDDYPTVEVLADSDVLIQPVNATSVDQALAMGGCVSIIRRWTKAQIEQMLEDGEIDEAEGEALLGAMSNMENQGNRDAPKKHADAAGVKRNGQLALVYEVWSILEVGGQRRLCVTKFGSDQILLSCRRNPYWSDRCPLISVPVKRMPQVAKGIAPAAPCMRMQYAANDAINEGMDSATYALLPIVMTDPLKNPKTSTMILDLAAVWEVSPNDTKFAEFPQLWKGAFDIVGACTQNIFQTLGVNPAMLPQSTGKPKRNQAEIAIEQQVDILMTADAVTVLEEGIFTEILTRFAEMDAQFRSTEISVRTYGYMGQRAIMEQIPPLQLGTRYNFLWYGVEQARNAAQIQQQIAFLNVLRGIPPQMLPGRRINMVPAIEHAAAAVFGPRLAPAVFEDLSKQESYDPDLENQVLEEGHPWPVAPLDDDAVHIQAHMAAVARTSDPHGVIQQHIAKHRMQQIQKAQAAQAEQQGGQPGTPGGAPQSGIAGVPRPGGQVAGPRLSKQPPGAIAPEQMGRAGAVVPPRRM